jgi:polyketide synthase PksN
MADEERLHRSTKAYLASAIAEATAAAHTNFDSRASFAELAIDSFRVLKLIKRLEGDFGTLPKTLLFENFNIEDLAGYLVRTYPQVIVRKFGPESPPTGLTAMRTGPASVLAPVPERAPAPERAAPVLMLEKDALEDPQLGSFIRQLFESHKNEAGASRGARDIAPNLFIGRDRRGYFNYGRCKDIILAYAYTGPDDHFDALAQEMYEHCASRGLQLNIFTDRVLESVGAVGFSSTPFGALQRVTDLQNFSLEGGAMRRLRYQVSKFAKAGACRTEEYRAGTRAATDRAVAGVIDQWCAGKSMVNPLIHVVREEILAGTLHPQHRLFLTYVDDVLQNAILISPLSAALNGYLMDLEFYGPQMPLGGLEFAIAAIIQQLKAEGCSLLSLGGTYGCRLETCASADPGIDRVLNDLHKQNVFNDEGNLQFKNKFRPENRTVYLCRPRGSGRPDNITDIIMMIADPAGMQTSDAQNHGTDQKPQAVVMPAGPTAVVAQAAPSSTPPPTLNAARSSRAHDESRAETLAHAGFNPLNIPLERVELDLQTDSWAQLKMPAIDGQMTHLRSQLQQAAHVEESLRTVFPFAHFVLTRSGRDAEEVLYQAWPRKGVVLQNLLFPTGLLQQINQLLTPVELPCAAALLPDSPELFKAELAWDALHEALTAAPDGVAAVCVEVGNNATGGHPVSMRHLSQLKGLLARHVIPLIIDATRVLENARFLLERDSEQAGKSLWAVTQEMLRHADVVVCSLAKDFCLNRGGLIATNEAGLFGKLSEVALANGCCLDAIDRKLVALSFQDRRRIEAQVSRRMQAAQLIWESLRERGIPVVQPAGGHCVLIDVKRIPEFQALEHPVASFLAWMYLNTGIRAGAHSVGMQKGTAINGLVRLAVPVGLKAAQVEDIIVRIVDLFDRKENIPDLFIAGGARPAVGDLHTKYEVRQIQHPRARTISQVEDVAPASTTASVPAAEAVTEEPPRRSGKPYRVRDIAIVGMAGRYPKARDLGELWANLTQGVDCIRDIPAARLERRRQGADESYRGGFIDDVDRFDSLFFNISPREAELLDPQERLFLEVAWEAVEDAGYYPETLVPEDGPRDIGVFVGAVWAMYQMLGVEERHTGSKVSPNSFLWGIANRVSYVMNLCGPSLTVDTACSSSLTALYLACEAIYKGECSAAIVGGVNLDLHQSKLDINRVGGALSNDGVCRSFGKGANGYVAGEGVGALLIKPLEEAIRAGDNIHGVIKSVVVNHGGRSSGYAVPNPRAQSELIVSAHERAGVDARTIGYVEAHGTGTKLGDPVETKALTDAFEQQVVARQSCAIGSVKTNIGHLEAAAGVVGVCKVLLQMHHRMLAPSLHSAELNEFIDFESSPFYVVQKLEPWQPKEVEGVRFPLRAGVSSFGAGGSNAHVILECYAAPAAAAGDEDANADAEQVFPLSARNDEELSKVAVRLGAHIERHREADLRSIASTLQAGRKPFESRVAIVAKTQDELLERLTCFIDGKRHDKVMVGSTRNIEAINRLLSRKEQEEVVNLLARSRDCARLAQLWVDGLFTDWRWRTMDAVRRISLPTYPFADRRHWIGSELPALDSRGSSQSGIHPLLDTNESTFERQLFKKTFHNRDFFIYDHRVAQIPTLPGVAYLEFARKAAELAAGRRVRRIRNILWLSPIAVRDAKPQDVLIELLPRGEVVHFEVFSEGESGTKTVHSQGQLFYASVQETQAQPQYIDLNAIRARCTKVIEGRTAYALFDSLGLGLGPSFQVLADVYKSDSEVLGALRLPASRQGDLHSMLLHPSLIDGSLQAGVAAHLAGEAGEMMVPYSIGEVEVLHPLQPNCWSYVTRDQESQKKGSRVSRAHVLIVDDQGKILVKIRDSTGVALREIHKPSTPKTAADDSSKLYYTYEWRPAALQSEPATASARRAFLLFDKSVTLRDVYEQRSGGTSGAVVLVQPGQVYEESDDRSYQINPANPEDFTRLLESLQRRNVQVQDVCFTWSDDPATLERGAHALLFFCQALAKHNLRDTVRVLYVYGSKDGDIQPYHAAINGFAAALHIEHPRIFCKTVELRGTANSTPERILEAVVGELRPETGDAAATRYEGEERYVRKLAALDLQATARSPALPGAQLKEKGVYLITGGTGGLGLLFADFLARDFKARLVLTGRSELAPVQQVRLQELQKAGADVVYLRADVADRDQIQRVIAQSRERFGRIDGIIHAAGVLRDSYIRNKTLEQMQAVFAPKIQGTLHLDELTRQDELDFFVLFSSLAAIGGNAGQCDYGFANHFMDSFALQREQRRAQGARSGKTVSFNWSLWEQGGMRLDEQTELLFRKATGIKPLSSATGVEAFVRGLSCEHAQVAVVEGDRDRLEQAWGLKRKEIPATAAAPVAAPATAAADGDLVAGIRDELEKLAIEMLKLDASDLSSDRILLDLGFDSIGLATYANKINAKYPVDITPILFFDYPSIGEIARHLASEKREEVLRVHRETKTTTAPAASVAPLGEPQPVVRLEKGWNPAALQRQMQPLLSGASWADQRFTSEPIAIVGMSGVMPQSANLQEFWENLRDGRDLITLVPEDRWRWQDYYGDPLKEANKSNSKWGGFMKEVDKFDPLFFGIAPREAQMMDPQQRIFLQTVWQAIEDSGHKVADLAGTKTGLFVGVATNDYINLVNRLQIGIDGYTASGNSHSVLANRVSYLLNLRGPSAPLDTACSSSLVALHRAIESIHTGSCEMAIVGGVQVMLTPAAHISFAMAGMLSPDGQCRTFDKDANGYVRGEGAGAIFIKPLSKAEADGDHIYAVIKATAENHGGRVTTLTAPNASAQAELLVEAYQKAGIDPATVGYIECHGTGTSLGDPIEIQALSRAFAALYKRNGKATPATPHCGLSSVKTNIGHLETAAGVAGVLKALLAIKHQQIPANIHFEEVNPYINLEGTPFYIVAQTQQWQAPEDGAGTRLPRRAGVSSFGFGGANAHIVLEEYIPARTRSSNSAEGPRLIVLSARSEERLREYARSMLAHIQGQSIDLDSFAYTLQVGRDELHERLAFVAAGQQELEDKFSAFVQEGDATKAIYRGSTRGAKNAHTNGAEAAAAHDAARALIESGDLGSLAKLWVAGTRVDWSLLYKSGKPVRVPLPTYPFARERCWMPSAENVQPAGGVAQVARLHPLIHHNTSTFQEQKFATRLSGDEFFLQDHVVDTQKILPGVAYMEMARAAGQLAAGRDVRVIRNLVWVTPLIVGNEAADVEVALTPNGHEVDFKVNTGAPDRPLTHCTGQLGYEASGSGPEVIDVAAIRARCPEEVLTADELYRLLASLGLKLGKSFQIVRRMWASDAESLAVLQLPQHIAQDASQYWLHPALMDGSLHSAIGMMRQGKLDFPLSLPFAIAEMRILHPLTNLYYGYATWAEADDGGQNRNKVNFQLLDATGRVLVSIREFVFKPLQRELPAPSGASDELQSGLQSLVPLWSPAPKDIYAQVNVPRSSHVLVLGSNRAQLDWTQQCYPNAELISLSPDADVDSIASQLVGRSFDELLWMAPNVTQANDLAAGTAGIIEQQNAGVLSVLRTIKALLGSRYTTEKLRWTVVTQNTQKVHADEPTDPAHAAVWGLIGSAAKEYSHWDLRLLDVESLQSITARECLSLAWDKQGKGLAHRRGEWFQQDLASVTSLPETSPSYRQGGVYVVIGGAGGIGEVWSRYLIERYQARMVWIGRRKCDATIQRKIDALAALGAAPLYVVADATRLDSLEQAYSQILQTYPTVHGVAHSALILRDQSLAQMDEAAFKASLSVKLDASVNIDRVFGGLPLDFMLFFSSLVAFNRPAGQANYAAGCTFKDSFAHHLQQRRTYPVKIMNWGYWGDVGVVAKLGYRKAMEQMGIGSIEPAEGMASLERLISSQMSQVAVLRTLNARATTSVAALERVAHYPKETASILARVRQRLAQPSGGARAAELLAELPSPEQDSLVTEILAATLKSMRLLDPQSGGIAALRGDKSVPDFYERWLSASRRYLQRMNVLDSSQKLRGHLREQQELWAEWQRRKSDWVAARPHSETQTLLLESCLQALPDLLTGRRLATDVIFPRSSMHLVQAVYRGNPLADYFNEVLSETLSACIEQWLQADSTRKIRILEIGAGTGGTTAKLLPFIQKFGTAIAEYCYTDVSKAFLQHAAEHYQPACPAMSTAIFDVCKPLSAQSIPAGHYDLVVAANVLHATPSLREVVRNAKATLKTNGVLLLNEISTWSAFAHLTFGLLEGWWLHEDTALRFPDSPGVPPRKWAQLLAAEGFESVFFPAAEAHELGQQIVVGASDGVIRQRAARRAPAKVTLAAKTSAATAPSPVAVVEPHAAGHTGSEHVRKLIAGHLSQALQLQLDRVRDDEPFAEYGVDSIIGVNLVRSISESLGIELETTSLFEHSTVNDLTRYICSKWQPQISALIGAPTAPPQPSASSLQHRFAAAERRAEAGRRADLEPMASSSSGSKTEPVAIIGMGGRFAESESLEQFWQNLREGKDLVKPVSRWNPAQCVLSDDPTANGCRHGSFIESADRFDPAFFRISPVEALHMDPQQRLFLEECWKALEDAGYAGKALRDSRCGVYVGCGSSKYDTLFTGPTPAQAFWGNSEAVIPARIAYYLDLKGPAIAVNTACSSSLVSIHLACQGLWSGETDMALAGGVFLQPTSGFYQVANRAGMLSPSGKCHSFDSRADGFVPGEGVGVIVLKRLSDAWRDGDHIHGVIAGSGINQDGTSNGLIAPNAAAQERLERDVYERFNIDPQTIQLVEAHGTGTLLGDSIELGALTRAFRKYTNERQFCALGSVKTNIGHAAGAAGVAGVLKILLALRQRQIPPSLHFQQANPGLDLERSPFYVNTASRDWETPAGHPRRAAISSFGFSGTNAHLVIQEGPSPRHPPVQQPGYLIVLSARSGTQLEEQARNLVAFLERMPGLSVNDLSYTLFVGRAHLGKRLACVTRDQSELIQMLKQWLASGTAGQVFVAQCPDEQVRERPALRRFGNHCLEACKAATPEEYVEHLTTLADLYSQGYRLDYEMLFAAESCRVPLPTYPFARERYWADSAGNTTAETTVAVTAGRGWQASSGPQDKAELLLKQAATVELGVPLQSIGAELSYFDLGLTSLGVTNLIRKTNELLQANLPPAIVFEHPSIRSLAEYLVSNYGSQLNAAVLPQARDSAIRLLDVETQISPAQILEQIAWNNGSDAAGYEKLTF